MFTVTPKTKAAAGIRKFWRRPTVRYGFGGLGIVALALGGYLGVLQLVGNYHTVIAGELYRSAQPTASRLKQYIAEDGIRTIINLRGASPNASWYQAERKVAEEAGVEMIDIRLSASNDLTDTQIDDLLAKMTNARKPLLVHCKSGADRSGIASALYLAAIAKQGEEAAEGQLSLLYGHIGLPFFPAAAMERTFERMEPALGFPDS